MPYKTKFGTVYNSQFLLTFAHIAKCGIDPLFHIPVFVPKGRKVHFSSSSNFRRFSGWLTQPLQAANQSARVDESLTRPCPITSVGNLRSNHYFAKSQKKSCEFLMFSNQRWILGFKLKNLNPRDLRFFGILVSEFYFRDFSGLKNHESPGFGSWDPK